MSATNIFARSEADGRQSLVYSMRLDAERDVAMVLPLPVAPGTGEDGVRFVDLSGYPTFFADLDRAWPRSRTATAGGPTPAPAAAPPEQKLKVVEVGGFEASFVPTSADFSRLDERFRLPADTWEKLPLYRTYGFAVFKFKPGKRDVHPMAFSFPRADRRSLFFPTVHIHDGVIHERAVFDHWLYAQRAASDAFVLTDWEESGDLLARHIALDGAKGLVDPEVHGYRRLLVGRRLNRDTILSPA